MNEFVDFINQFYSQNASQNAAYTEHSKRKLEGIDLKISKLIDDFEREKLRIVILTGNAGDGKTFICKEIYQRLFQKNLPNEGIHKCEYKGKTLYIIKDASEVPTDKLTNIVEKIEKSLGSTEPPNTSYLLAGNEGKLSELFSKYPSLEKELEQALGSEFTSNLSNDKISKATRGWFETINFNWRALVEQKAFNSIIDSYLRDEDWEVCKSCKFLNQCPIQFNVQALKKTEIKDSIRTIFKFYHYKEGHFTLRELFSSISYIITAGNDCEDVSTKIGCNDEFFLNYLFYNNIFSSHKLIFPLKNFKQEDRILKEISKYDVIYAPLPELHRMISDFLENKADRGSKFIFRDLTAIIRFFSKLELNKTENNRNSTELYDILKRRVFFIKDHGDWPGGFIENYKKITQTAYQKFLPFEGFAQFDKLICKKSGGLEVIIRGLNLLANQQDIEPDFWLKVYKPERGSQSYRLQLTNEIIEDLDPKLLIEGPQKISYYLEIIPRLVSLAIETKKSDEKNIQLHIDIEMFELLNSAALGGHAKQHFTDILGIIEDFRESLFYKLLEQIPQPKFRLSSQEFKMDKAIQIILKGKNLIAKLEQQ